ncbi:MAG: hypothetical protein RIS47_161 [Bacteroidota bacterium]|jgi:large subunit ribosomal protein L25
MKTFQLNGELRQQTGKKETKKLRVSDLIPCVVYGGEEVLHFSVSQPDVRGLIYSPDVFIVELNVAGKIIKATIKELQFAPVDDKLRHIDFYQVTDTKPVIIDIPVRLEGFAVGVQQGGKLQQVLRRLKVKGLIADLPAILTIDVTNMDLGKTVKVGELTYDNIELLDTPSAVVAAVKLTRAARGQLAAKTGK